jgi:hypothetical protein
MGELALRFFDNRCYVGRQKYKVRDGFSIHHLRYIDSDIKFDKFPSGAKGKRAYHEHLRTQVEKDPNRFRLIKKMWHAFVDATPNRPSRINGLSRIKPEEWERLKQLVDDTDRKIKIKQHFKRYRK